MKNLRNKYGLMLITAITMGIIFSLIYNTGILESIELKTLDFRFRQLDKPKRANKEVLLITIDDRSIEEFRKNRIFWQWPRSIYSVVTDYLKKSNAKIIIYDILFIDPDIDRLDSEGIIMDSLFAASIKNAGNVVLAAQLKEKNEKNKIDYESKNLLGWYPKALDKPIDILAENALTLGFSNIKGDIEDGICRRIPLIAEIDTNNIPQLGFAALFPQNELKYAENKNKKLQISEIDIPLDRNGNFFINWYGRGGISGCFKYYSFASVFKSALDEMNGITPELPSDVFRNKYIIIGANASGLFDYRETPFTLYEPYPGMEISATIISNILNKDYLIRINETVLILLIFMICILISLSFLFFDKTKYRVTSILSLIFLWTLISFIAFNYFDFWIDIVIPVFSALATFTVLAVISYNLEGKEKKHIKNAFSRYVTPAVIDELIKNRTPVELGGKEITGTVLFSDLKDFTAISEGLKPSVLVDMLNKYFSISVASVTQNNGMLDKFIGDSIMALFGAPIETGDHQYRACCAALEIQKNLREQWQHHSVFSPMTRIGINSGEMIVGNIGSKDRLDYTAIGDSVNIASRLESANKVYGTDIIIGEYTYEAVKNDFITRELDLLHVKGKIKAIRIYELICRKEDVEDDILSRNELFEKGLKLFRGKQLNDALIVFQDVYNKYNQDTVSNLYIERCREYLKISFPSDWDGVYDLKIK